MGIHPFFTKDAIKDHRYEIGDFTYGMFTLRDWDKKYKLRIGKFCSLGEKLIIFLDGNHYSEWITTYPLVEPKIQKHFVWTNSPYSTRKSKGDVNIGNAVWIGEGVTILSGVTIGDGVIIGAGSVVTKNIPPYTLAAGNPCIIRKKLFSDKDIEKLLKIKWWDWSTMKIRERAHILCSSNLKELFRLEGME